MPKKEQLSNGNFKSNTVTLEDHSNEEDEEKQGKMGRRERGGEECPGLLQQPFGLSWANQHWVCINEPYSNWLIPL